MTARAPSRTEPRRRRQVCGGKVRRDERRRNTARALVRPPHTAAVDYVNPKPLVDRIGKRHKVVVKREQLNRAALRNLIGNR